MLILYELAFIGEILDEILVIGKMGKDKLNPIFSVTVMSCLDTCLSSSNLLRGHLGGDVNTKILSAAMFMLPLWEETWRLIANESSTSLDLLVVHLSTEELVLIFDFFFAVGCAPTKGCNRTLSVVHYVLC